MKDNYQTKDTCSTKVTFDLNGDTIYNLSFTGGFTVEQKKEVVKDAI